MNARQTTIAQGLVSADPVLRVHDLHWAPGRSGEEVLKGTRFDLREGNLTVLIGPSGCGKSTLGYLIAGYETADSGWIEIDGARIGAPGPNRLMVFQESALWPWMSVLDNVSFGPAARGELSRSEAESRARRLLGEFGLGGFVDKYPGQLSGGMKRRVDIAQALINGPRLLILDEPFRGLDVMTRELMQEYFLQLFENRSQTTLFITSEVEEAVFLADEVLVMDRRGRIARRLDVGLPRPRRAEAVDTPEFQEAQMTLLAALEAIQDDAF
jgi:NitT/TauT family transport system ATP-binding protein